MDKFDASVLRARTVGPLVAFALVATALVVPNVAHTPEAHAEDAGAADVTVADDFTSARVDAKAQGHRIEVLSERTETSQTFVSAKGAITREIAAAPVRVRDSSSDGWGPIDLALSKQPDGSYAPGAVPGDVRLSGGEDADSKGVLVALGAGKRSISLGWAGALPEPTVRGATATYADVQPGIDLKVEVTRSGVEQYFVLKERPAAGEEPTLALPVSTSGVSIADDAKPGQTIETKSGDEVGSISPALTWDATTSHGVHTQTDVSDSEVKTVDGKRSLVITPDAEFLQSPDTTYPVTIDPSVTLTGSSISDVYLKSTAPDGNVGGAQLLVGTNDSGTTKYRSLVTVKSGAAMSGATIQSASLGLWENSSASCTATPVTAYGFATRHYAVNQTWNNQPADINNPTTVTTAKGYSSSCAAGWVNFDVAQQLQASLDARWDVMTVEFRADETANSGFKSFDSVDGAHVPTLTVTYDLPPAKPLAPAVSAGTTGATKVYTSSLSPSFTATSADPETENVKYTYNVYNAATPQDSTTLVGTCTTGFVPSGSPASCSPNVTLSDGTSYWAKATATDATGVSGKASGSLYFATAAAKPTAPTISCPSPYTDGSWASSAPSSPVACSVSVVGNYKGLGPKQIVVSVDNADGVVTPVAANGTTTAPITVPRTAGVHIISAHTVSGAQLSSNDVAYRIGYGTPGFAAPGDGSSTIGPVKISAYAPFRGGAAKVTATLQWRLAGSSADGTGWNSVDSTDVTPSSTASSPVYKTTWDSASVVSDASVSPSSPVSAHLNQLLEIRVCFAYDAQAPQCTSDGGVKTRVLRIPSAFGDSFPTADAGEGTVALATGEFSDDVSDVNIETTNGTLSVDRAHSTFADPAAGPTAVFGAGWTAEFGAEDVGDGDLSINDNSATSGSIYLTNNNDVTYAFTTPTGIAASSPTGTYVPIDDATRQANKVLTVSMTGSTKTLTLSGLDGSTTVWKLVSGSSATWSLASAAQAASPGATTYTTDGSGRITRILAPTPAGVSCPTSGPLGAGCSYLRLTYATATTATSSANGDFSGQLKGVYYNTYDPTSSGMVEIKVAGYLYDAIGRLASASTPTNSQTRSYSYATYNGFTALTQTNTSGYAPFIYTYDTSGGGVRLTRVSRGAATAGGSDVVLSSYVYGATPGAAGPDLSAGQIAKWGQTRAPVSAYAVFGIDHPVIGAPSASDWRYAHLLYTDSAGFLTNTAKFGAGGWLVSADNYDENDVLLASLDSDDVDEAVADATAGITFDAQAKSAIVRYLPEVSGQSASVPVVAADSIPQDTWSAPFTTTLQDGTTAQVRKHTHYVYDSGAPNSNVNPATNTPYLSPTKVTVGVSGVSDTNTDPAAALPDDIETISTTLFGYDPIDGSSASGPTSGWTLGQPTTTTTVVPGGQDIVKKTVFDANGNVLRTIDPGSNGNDAGTTRKLYYSSGASADDAGCGNHPEWAGLVCWTGPAAAPESGPDIPDARTTYNRWLAPATLTETSGAGPTQASRTTTSTFFADGRLNTTAVSTSGVAGSVAMPKLKAVWSSSLIRTGTQTLATDGTITAQDVASVDLWGRMTKYLNSNGDNTNYAYVSAGTPGAGNLATVATSKGSTSYTYDGVDADGAEEHRGLLTGQTVSGVGTFAAAYNRTGQLVTQAMPAGVVERLSYDDSGRPSGIRYLGDVSNSGTTTTGTWLSFNRSYDSSGRAASDWTPSGASTQIGGYTRGYSYDGDSRLQRVEDSTGTAGGPATCTTRTYSFDARSNRTSRTVGSGSDCSNTNPVTTTWSYDAYSRSTTGANGSGTYTYDALGRQLTVPGADATQGGSDSTLTYYDDDSVQSIAQAGQTTTFSLDPDLRAVSTSSSDGSNTVDHYIDGSSRAAWSVRAASGTTTTSRYITGIDGSLVASTNTSTSTVVSLQLGDMTGAVAATVVVPTNAHATSIAGTALYDEFGSVLSSATATGVNQYGWLAGAQRVTTSSGLQLLGARLYNPQTGRFTSRDPIAGGNKNAYTYPNDPVNSSDDNGETAVPLPPGAGSLAFFGMAAAVVAVISLILLVFKAGGQRVTWKTKGEITADGKRALAKARNVPFPSATSYKAKHDWSDYRIYRIYAHSNTEANTWKYGITKQDSDDRINKGVKACNDANFAGVRHTCSGDYIGRAKGYYAARIAEAILITRYVVKRYNNGMCPPGQKFSCM